ncbi:hypothetical protein KC330_g4630 [Hortaea werneckii]|nr:hypothetical protein KC330_g4630 [Hortaea werneckii]
MTQTGPWDWLPEGMFGRDFGSLANTPPCVRAGVLEIIRDNQHLAFEYSENLFGTDSMRDTHDKLDFDIWPTLEEGFNLLHRSSQGEGLQWPESHEPANSLMWSRRPVVNGRSADPTSNEAGSGDAAIKTWERLTHRQYPRFERKTVDDHRVPATVQLSETQIQQEAASSRAVEHREHAEEHVEDPEEEHVEESLNTKGEQSEEPNHREAFTEAAHLKFMATLARPCFSALPIADQKWSMKVYREFAKEKDLPEEARRSIADDLKRLQPSDRAQFQWSDVDMDESDVVDDVYLPEAAEKAQALLEKMLAGEPSSSTVLILKDALELSIPIQWRLVILTMAQVVFPKFTIRTGSVTLDAFLTAHRSELEKWKSIG